MHCPTCNTTLIQETENHLTVNKCPVCNGVLISSTTISEYLKAITQKKHIPTAPIDLTKRPINLYNYTERKKICPNCSTTTILFNYRYDSNIFLNKCPNCKNIWIDGEELIPLASIVKGNPKLTDLGKTLVEIDKLKEEERQNAQFVSPAVVFQTTAPILLSDEHPTQIIPFVTYGLITLCTIILLVQEIFIHDIDRFYKIYAFIPDLFSPISLFTALFLHGNLYHLFGNMFFLWVFGDNIEEKVGHWHYLALYLLFGAIASLFSALTGTSSNIPHIGASGAISGLLGAYIVLYPTAKLKVLWFASIRKISAWIYISLWFFGQMIDTLMSSYSGIDYFAHIFGFIVGACAAYQIKKMKDLSPSTIS